MEVRGCVANGLLEETQKMPEEVYTAVEVAVMLKISPNRVRQLLRAKSIRGVDVNPGGRYHKWRVPKQSLEEYLAVEEKNRT